MDRASVLDMAEQVSKSGEDQPAMLFALLQLLDWDLVEKELRKRVLFVKAGIDSADDPVLGVTAIVGVALGKLRYDG